MTKEEIKNLKEQYERRAHYYRNISFPILAEDFQKIANLLQEIENTFFSSAELIQEERIENNV